MTDPKGHANVQGMNNKNDNLDDYRSLLLLDEISKNKNLTQRDLSKKLGVALGLVNSYIKNLIAKGYITVSMIPRNRYRYYLTPRGFTEKTRLTYQHLQNFTNLYRVARRDFSLLFAHLERSKQRKIVFCGVDEVAEIAFLSLKEAELDLLGVVDDAKAGRNFFGLSVAPLKDLSRMDYDLVVITSFRGGDELVQRLAAQGVSMDKICDISSGGWIKRIRPEG